jgi:TRAP-type C4-dicarboxylate transport system substrate-binding protein
MGLGWMENEFRDLTNSKREVRRPEDMAGLKIRVMKSAMAIDTFKELGASPVDLPFSELYSALQNGTIDAQENPLLTSIMVKATEVTKYVTKTNHMLTECIIIVGIDFWDRLSPEQQKIFQEAALVALKVNREENEALSKELPQSGLSIEEYCRQENIQVAELTSEEKEAFKTRMTKVWEKYRKKIGVDLYDFFMEKVKGSSD